jgi:SAM-dependent methyltransferase
MNKGHAELCSSPEWAEHIAETVLPAAIGELTLGDEVLAATFPRANVVQGSGDDLLFDDGRFSAVVCFTMLHHVLTPEMQDGLFAEARRVLRPGGVFAGSDSIDNEDWREFHGGDTCVPVVPDDLPRRLTTPGFVDVDVRVVEPDGWFTFCARA